MQAGSGTRSHRAPALPSRVQAAFHLRTPAAAAGRRHLVILAARNPFKEAQQDVLPNGSPNTPVRRISYEIAHALSPGELCRLMQAKRHTAPQDIWRSKHEAAVLQRLASLIYYKALAGEKSRRLVSGVEALLRKSAEVVAHSSEVVRQVEGSAARQLLASCARMGAAVPRALSDSLLAELLRGSGRKLPCGNVSHMAELVWALAMLRAGFPKASKAVSGADRPGAGAPDASVARSSTPSPSPAPVDESSYESGTAGPPSFEDEALPSSSQQSWGGSTAAAGRSDVGWAGVGVAGSAASPVQVQGEEVGPGPGAPIWEAAAQRPTRTWLELQRCTLLSLQQQLLAQKRHQRRRRGKESQGSGDSKNRASSSLTGASSSTSLSKTLPGASAASGPASATADAPPSTFGSGRQTVAARLSRRARICGRVGPDGLSQIAWAFAVAGCHDPQLFRVIESVAVSLPAGLHGAQPRVLANLAYAFAKAGQPCPRLMPLLCAAFAESLHALQAAGTAGAQDSVAYNSPAYADALALDAGGIDSLPAVPSQQAAGALAVPGSTAGPQPGAATVGSLPEAAHIAKLLWATVALGHKDAALLDAVAAALPVAKLRFTASDLAHVAWAFAQHHHQAPSAFEHLARLFVLQRMYSISHAQLAMLASAFASARHVNVPLQRTILRLTCGRLDDMPSKDLVTIVCALASVGRDCDLLIGAATEAAMRDPAAVGSTGLAQLLAALQATGYLNWRTALLTRMAEGPDHPANGAAASQRKHDLTAQLKSRTRMARQASAKQGTGSRTAERSAYNDNGTSSALVPARALAAT